MECLHFYNLDLKVSNSIISKDGEAKQLRHKIVSNLHGKTTSHQKLDNFLVRGCFIGATGHAYVTLIFFTAHIATFSKKKIVNLK